MAQGLGATCCSRAGHQLCTTALSSGARSPFWWTTMSSSSSQAARSRSSAASSRGLVRRARLGVRRLDQECAGLAVGLEVDPADDPVAEQERQHVVAELPLGLGDVDLDPVVEVEDVLGALALPHHRVERAEQRPGVDLARQRGVAVQPGGPFQPSMVTGSSSPSSTSSSTARWPTSCLAALSRTGSSRRGNAPWPRRGSGRPDGRAPWSPRRVGHRREHRGREHPLGQVVDRLELRVAAGDGEVARRRRGSRAPCGPPTSSSPSRPCCRGPPSSRSRAVEAPRSRTWASTCVDEPGLVRNHAPHRGLSRKASIRWRITGHRSTGMKAWTCAQYSTIRRGFCSEARLSISVS